TAIVSGLVRKPVSHDIAMTGEITLRGRVLAIGGLKEKILAAHRGRVKKVIIPKDNEKDLRDIRSNMLKDVETVTVEHMDDVIREAIVTEEPILQDIVVPPPST
ncbi:endopeptidase La, partial [Desulfobacterota bacterium AH_259_B03_O07]|nr:endopeptidase La [Desulfobacterota bacterium AH_259_B03_O07]